MNGGPSGDGGQRGRVLAWLLALVVVALLAAWAVLDRYGSEIFAEALRRGAAANGLVVEFESPPVLRARGFEIGAVTVSSSGSTGRELLRADAISAGVRFLARSPWVGVTLTVTGARSSPFGSPSSSAKAEAPRSSPWPQFPPQLSRLFLEDARVDLGDGRAIALDGDVVGVAGGGVEATWSRLDYSEADGENAAEKLSGRARVVPVPAAGAGDDPAGGIPSLRFETSLDSGAALLGAVLLDFETHGLGMSGVVSMADGGSTSLSGLALSLGRLFRVTGRVDLDAEGSLAAADVEVTSDALEPAFATLVREPFGGVMPALADAVLRGRGKVTLKLAAPSRHAAVATVALTVPELRTRALEAESLHVDLPWVGASSGVRSERRGRLRADGFSILGLRWTGLDAALVAAGGRIRAAAPQQWKTAGGTVRISDLVYEDTARSGPSLAADLRLEGFDLARLGKLFGVEGLAGALHGDLGRVRIDENRVQAAGVIDVEAFGGSIRLSKLGVDEPFGRVPSFGLDAKLSEILLGDLTGLLGVGRINGVLEGEVTGLVVAAGQPVAFDADLHTVDRRGVPQNVDVRAIRQLGVLGGGDTGSLGGALMRVVDRYRYSALGLRCRLRNDVFEIRGVRSEGGKDYLVKGSLLPPSVSVVSHSQVVSFSEMLKRIDRITTIGEGGSQP